MHRQSVPVVAFSADSTDGGRRLVTVGRDENHCVAVYHTLSGNWEDGRLLCYAQVHVCLLCDVCVTPLWCL